MSEKIVAGEASEADALKYLDFARELVLFDAGRDGEEPTEEIKAGLADLLSRAKVMLNEGAKDGEERQGATIGGRIQTVIEGERQMLEWHLCINLKDESEIAAAEMKQAIKQAIRAALKDMTGGPVRANVADKIREMLGDTD